MSVYTMPLADIIAGINEGRLAYIHYEGMYLGEMPVSDFGWLDLSDGTEGRFEARAVNVIPGGMPQIELKLWFPQGQYYRTPGMVLESKQVELKQDGFWRPAGVYTLERVAVVITQPWYRGEVTSK